MPESTNIGSLDIEIAAESSKANRALADLYKQLGLVGNALQGISTGNMNSIARSVNSLQLAMSGMKSIGKPDYNRLAAGIESLTKVNAKELYSSASALNAFGRSLSGIQISDSASQIATVASSVARLGYKTTDKAIENIPKLASALDSLIRTLSKAPAINSSVVSFTNSLGNLVSSSNNAWSKLSNVTYSQKESNVSIGNLSKSFRSLSGSMLITKKNTAGIASAFGMFYAKCFLLIRGVKQLGSAIEESMDYVETFNYFDVTMKKIGKDYASQYNKFGYDSAEAYADSFENRLNQLTSKMTGYNVGDVGELTFSNEKNLGLDPNQIMGFQARIGAITNSVGLVGEASVATSKALTMLSADLSSLTNTDLSSVMSNLASGVMGQSRALYKYGIDITSASLAQEALNLGIAKSVTEMSQSEKMQLRVLSVLEQSKIAWADQINTINTASNQYRVMSQQMSNLGRVIGNLFLPIVERVLPVVNGMTIALNKLFTTLGFKLWGDNWLSDVMGGISGGAGSASDDLEDLEDSIDGISDGLASGTAAAKELKRTLLSFDEMNVLNDNSSSSSGKGSGGSGAGIDLTDQINAALADYEKVWNDAFDSMDNKAQRFANSIEKAFEPIGKFLNQKEWESAGIAIGQLITKGLENIDSFIEWGNVKGGVSKAIDTFTDIINGIVNGINWRVAGKTVGDGITTITKSINRLYDDIDWRNLGKSFATGLNSLDTAVDWDALGVSLTNKISALTDTAYGFFTHFDWRRAGKSLGDSFNAAVRNINFKKVGATLSAGVTGLTTELESFAKRVNWTKIGSDIGQGLASIDWIGAISSVASSVIRAASGVLAGFESRFAGTMEGFLLNSIGGIKVINSAGSFAQKMLDVIQKADISGSTTSLAGKIGDGISTALKAAPLIATAASAIIGLISAAVSAAKRSRELQEIDVFGDTVDNLVDKTKTAAEEISRNIDSITKSGESDYLAQTQQIRDLAEVYENLSGKTNLTASESETLRAVSEKLVALLPDLNEVYDEENGKLDIQADALNEIIENNEKRLRQKAYEDILTNLYKEQAQAQIDQKEALDNYNKALDVLNQKTYEFNNLSADQAAQQGITGKEVKAAQDSVDELKVALDSANGALMDCNGTIAQYQNMLYGTNTAQSDFANNTARSGRAAANGMTAPLKDATAQIDRTLNQVVRIANKQSEMRSSGSASGTGWKNGLLGVDFDSAARTKMGRVKALFNITGDLSSIGQAGGYAYVSNMASSAYNQSIIGNATSGIKGKMNLSAALNAQGIADGQSYVTGLDAGVAKAKGTSVNAKHLIVKANADGGVFSGGRWKPITEFAGGGYPDGSQLFIARERGPEMVGTIGNRTAVINNDQIVASVAAGVANAVAAVMSQYSGNGTVNVVLQGDVKRFFKAMQAQARDYSNQTGKPAFT